MGWQVSGITESPGEYIYSDKGTKLTAVDWDRKIAETECEDTPGAGLR
jgi:hypothetical protein